MQKAPADSRFGINCGQLRTSRSLKQALKEKERGLGKGPTGGIEWDTEKILDQTKIKQKRRKKQEKVSGEAEPSAHRGHRGVHVNRSHALIVDQRLSDEN